MRTATFLVGYLEHVHGLWHRGFTQAFGHELEDQPAEQDASSMEAAQQAGADQNRDEIAAYRQEPSAALKKSLTWCSQLRPGNSSILCLLAYCLKHV